MIPYASYTRRPEFWEAIDRHGWRVLLSPPVLAKHAWEPPPPSVRYAIDNGAWSAFNSGQPFDGDALLRTCEAYGDRADWVVLPDIVGGGLSSLELSISWIPRLSGMRHLIAVQDGMVPDDLSGIDGGVFLGGTTEWKLETLESWGDYCRLTGRYFHVARVNTSRRIFRCQHAGADSFDGTNVTKWPKNIRRLDGARKQGDLFRG